MKANYKVTAVLVVAALFGGFFVANAATTSTADRQAQYCQNFLKNAELISRGVRTSATNIAKREESRGQRLVSDRERRTQQLIAAKEKAQERREAMYERLLSYANTDVKKEAVEKYKAATEESVKKREAVVDAEIERIRKSADEKRSYDLDGLNDALKSALDGAKDQCENGEEVTKVRSDFMAKINDIRKTFQGTSSSSSNSSSNSKSEQVLKAAEEAKEKTKEAEEKFKTEVQTTQEEVKVPYSAEAPASSETPAVTTPSGSPQLSLETSQARSGNEWWMVVMAWNVDGFGTCRLQVKPDGGTYSSGFILTPNTVAGLTGRMPIDIQKSSTFRISCPNGEMSKEIHVPVSLESSNSGDSGTSADTGGSPSVDVTSPTIVDRTQSYRNEIAGGGPITIRGTAENTSKVTVEIKDEDRGTRIQTCHAVVLSNRTWSCTTANTVTARAIKVEIWNYESNQGAITKGALLYSFAARITTPDVAPTFNDSYSEGTRTISSGSMSVNLTSPLYRDYRPGEALTLSGSASGMFYVTIDIVASGWKSGYGISSPSRGFSKTWTIPTTVRPGNMTFTLYGAATAEDHAAGNKTYIGEFNLDVVK